MEKANKTTTFNSHNISGIEKNKILKNPQNKIFVMIIHLHWVF